jgi:hypothetical protein
MEFTPITEHLATKNFALFDMRRDCPLSSSHSPFVRIAGTAPDLVGASGGY